MKSKPAPVAIIAGFPITVRQTSGNKFTVTYGYQSCTGLDYYSAAREVGECIMHALACDGAINLE